MYHYTVRTPAGYSLVTGDLLRVLSTWDDDIINFAGHKLTKTRVVGIHGPPQMM